MIGVRYHWLELPGHDVVQYGFEAAEPKDHRQQNNSTPPITLL